MEAVIAKSKTDIAVEKAKEFVVGLFYENNEPSLTRVLTSVGFIAFLVVSGYLVKYNIQWAHYETFATITGGGSLGARLIDKGIMNKLASDVGQPYVKANSVSVQQSQMATQINVAQQGGISSVQRQ